MKECHPWAYVHTAFLMLFILFGAALRPAEVPGFLVTSSTVCYLSSNPIGKRSSIHVSRWLNFRMYGD